MSATPEDYLYSIIKFAVNNHDLEDSSTCKSSYIEELILQGRFMY